MPLQSGNSSRWNFQARRVFEECRGIAHDLLHAWLSSERNSMRTGEQRRVLRSASHFIAAQDPAASLKLTLSRAWLVDRLYDDLWMMGALAVSVALMRLKQFRGSSVSGKGRLFFYLYVNVRLRGSLKTCFFSRDSYFFKIKWTNFLEKWNSLRKMRFTK